MSETAKKIRHTYVSAEQKREGFFAEYMMELVYQMYFPD